MSNRHKISGAISGRGSGYPRCQGRIPIRWQSEKRPLSRKLELTHIKVVSKEYIENPSSHLLDASPREHSCNQNHCNNGGRAMLTTRPTGAKPTPSIKLPTAKPPMAFLTTNETTDEATLKVPPTPATLHFGLPRGASTCI